MSKKYQSMPLAKGEAEALEKGLKVEKTALGKETIDGHACVKNKVVVKNEQGAVLEAITWNATDLKDFPLQIEMKEKDNTSASCTSRRSNSPSPTPSSSTCRRIMA